MEGIYFVYIGGFYYEGDWYLDDETNEEYYAETKVTEYYIECITSAGIECFGDENIRSHRGYDHIAFSLETALSFI